jgi:hypothetical protein
MGTKKKMDTGNRMVVTLFIIEKHGIPYTEICRYKSTVRRYHDNAKTAGIQIVKIFHAISGSLRCL